MLFLCPFSGGQAFEPILKILPLTRQAPGDWTLRTAEVRKDRGKFVNTTWEYCFNGARYWATIGIGNFIKTIVRRDSSGVEKCLRGGEFYDYVERVNRELMDAETLENQSEIEETK